MRILLAAAFAASMAGAAWAGEVNSSTAFETASKVVSADKIEAKDWQSARCWVCSGGGGSGSGGGQK